jgi:hypothetical protein
MQFPNIRMHLVLAFLIIPWSVWAQEKVEREVEIHKNVKLTIMTAAPDIPAEISSQFRSFLPIFEDVLKQNTKDQSDECYLTLRLSFGLKEIGAAKVKRPMARVNAFRRNSKQEFLGTFILYSYATAGLVNKEETEQFLKKQILEPAECIGKAD